MDITRHLDGFNQLTPKIFTVETVLGCDLKCPECAVGAGIITRKKGWMTFEQFKIIADKIRPFCEYLYLHLWGEPLLNKDIYRIIKYASAFTKTNIHTNGNSLTEEKAERLITSGVTDISVSIDGVSQEVYEQYRKGGFVIKALWSLAKLKELNLKYGNRVNVSAQFVVFKHNQHEMDLFREFCQSLDVKPVYKAPYIRSDSQYENSDKPEYVRSSYPDVESLRQIMSVDCKNPREVFTILLDGTCVMCCYDHNGITNYGNIYEQDVLDIWNSPKYRKDRGSIITGNAPKFCIENCLQWTLKATTSTTETDLAKALRSRIESKPAPKVTTDSEAEKAWVDYRVRFRKAILEDDITDFMNWEVIKSTIYQGPPREELEFLKNLPTWSEFRNALYESFVGNPERYPLYPLSTGNQIHQAYTLAQLTETGGCPVKDLPQIVEFGGGFGSMCKLIHKLGFKGRYIIFDLPELSAMQEYYLKAIGIKTEVKIDEVTENESCVVLLSDIEQFKRQLEIPAESFAFIAVWSLSETPVDFRNQICDLVSNASYYLIAYQDYFRDATNLDYFAKLTESKLELAWHNYPIGHFPEHNYLIGTKNADKRQVQAGNANRNMLIEAAMKKRPGQFEIAGASLQPPVLRQLRLKPELPSVEKTNKCLKVQIIGSEYGSCAVILDLIPSGSTIISAGVGEDISFDLELIKLKNCKIIGIDPTEKARIYVENNKNEHFCFLNKALYSESNKKIRIYKNTNPDYVSESVMPSHNMVSSTEFYEVETITIQDLLEEYRNVSVLKIDIEGAEYPVLNSISDLEIPQIYVEFHHFCTDFTVDDTERCIERLNEMDYAIAYCKSQYGTLKDVTFVHRRYVNNSDVVEMNIKELEVLKR